MPVAEVADGGGDMASLVVGESVAESAAGEDGRDELGVKAKGTARAAGICLGLGLPPNLASKSALF